MKTLDYLHLDASGAGNVVDGLQQLLADFQVFYTNLRGFHWNIKGHGFYVLHGKFEDMYNDAAEKIDEIAERILMLGGVPENKFSEYLKKARIQELSNVSCGEEAVKSVLDSLSTLIEGERKLLSQASETNDESTVALLSDYLKGQEKTVWMLVSFLSSDCCECKE
jgi:starvation-inducible DNA-binding protein